MNILFVDPPGIQKGPNVGLGYLIGALKAAGHRTEVLDVNNRIDTAEDMLAKARAFGPDLVGYSMKTATYFAAVQIGKTLSDAFPQIPHLVGGPHVTLVYKDMLAELPWITAAAVGEGEDVILEAVAALTAGGDLSGIAGMALRDGQGGVLLTERAFEKELDAFAYPDYGYYIAGGKRISRYPLVTSRGCPYLCTYCCVPTVSGKKWRPRKPEAVIDEIRHAIDTYGVEAFDIIDDNFTLNMRVAHDFCDAYIASGLTLPWECPNGLRADRVTLELARHMEQAHCVQVMLGIESGAQEVFDMMQKGETLEDIRSAVRLFKQAGIRVGGYFIIGLPGDSMDHTLESLEFIAEVGLDYAQFNMLVPYPGTDVWEQFKANEAIFEDYRKGWHFTNEQLEPIFQTERFSAEEMVRAYDLVHTRLGLFHLMIPKDRVKMRKWIQKMKLVWKHDRSKFVERFLEPVAV